MFDEYKKTLLYFSQNFSVSEIAKVQGLTLRTMEKRLAYLQKKYGEFYANALSMRLANKRLKQSLLNPMQLEEDYYV